MNLFLELFRYHTWATLQLVDYCASQTPAVMQEIVVGTDRSILHTLTHIIGTEQEYLEVLMGRQVAPPVRAGEIISISEVRQRCKDVSRHWEALLDGLAQIDLTLPADGERPEMPHGQNVLVLQAIQHGIDHRTQISTTLHVLGLLDPPDVDGWSYWLAEHAAEP